jgi:hypothetical protein
VSECGCHRCRGCMNSAGSCPSSRSGSSIPLPSTSSRCAPLQGLCVCVCVCVRERERERESGCVSFWFIFPSTVNLLEVRSLLSLHQLLYSTGSSRLCWELEEPQGPAGCWELEEPKGPECWELEEPKGPPMLGARIT